MTVEAEHLFEPTIVRHQSAAWIQQGDPEGVVFEERLVSALGLPQLMVDLEQLEILLAQGVILFDSDIVGDTYDNFISVVSLREEAFAGGMAALGVAQRAAIYGATFMYIPKGAQGDTPFMVSSSDNTLRCPSMF